MLATVPRSIFSRVAIGGAVLIGLMLVLVDFAPATMPEVVDRGLRDTYATWKKTNEAKEAAKAKDKGATKPAEGAAAGGANPPAQATNNDTP